MVSWMISRGPADFRMASDSASDRFWIRGRSEESPLLIARSIRDQFGSGAEIREMFGPGVVAVMVRNQEVASSSLARSTTHPVTTYEDPLGSAPAPDPRLARCDRRRSEAVLPFEAGPRHARRGRPTASPGPASLAATPAPGNLTGSYRNVIVCASKLSSMSRTSSVVGVRLLVAVICKVTLSVPESTDHAAVNVPADSALDGGAWSSTSDV